MNIKKSILLRVRIAFLLATCFAVAVVAKVAKIQYADGAKWRKVAESTGLQFMKVKATRGNIYSNNGSLLATSLPFFRVSLDPTRVEEEVFRRDLDSLSMLLSRFFGDHSASDYKQKIMNARLRGRQYLALNAKLVTYPEKQKMSEWPIFREGRLKGGVIFEKTDKRFKPFSHLAFRTVGFITEENYGAGLEYSFNELLAGRDGEALFRKIAGGGWKPLHDETEIIPEKGLDIVTTIDVNLQDVAESSLEHHLREHDADYGCAVLMKVETGEILAIANLGKTPSGNYVENYNYAVGVQGLTDPGSTFKLVSLMALFEDTDMDVDYKVETGNGKFTFYDQVMTDSKEEGYGTISLTEAFAVSSNVAVSKLINEHFGKNPERFMKYINDFGINQPVGFQLVGEAKPRIKTPADSTWSGVTLPWMSVGYEINLAPIHTLTFYNAVANNGKMVSPVLVKSIYNADKRVQKFETAVLNPKICSDRTLNKLRILLEEVVDNGTASNIKNKLYKIAGKTGTAQKLVNGRYTKQYYTSFAGYFPANNPKYSCIVVIDSPKGFRQYGSNVAAPVFKEIADKIYATDPQMHRKLPNEMVAETDEVNVPFIRAGHYEDLKYLCNELGVSHHAEGYREDWVEAKLNNNFVNWKNKSVRAGVVPDVKGFTLRDALYLLENTGLRVRHTGTGRVKNQSQFPGAKVVRGTEIIIELG